MTVARIVSSSQSTVFSGREQPCTPTPNVSEIARKRRRRRPRPWRDDADALSPYIVTADEPLGGQSPCKDDKVKIDSRSRLHAVVDLQHDGMEHRGLSQRGFAGEAKLLNDPAVARSPEEVCVRLHRVEGLAGSRVAPRHLHRSRPGRTGASVANDESVVVGGLNQTTEPHRDLTPSDDPEDPGAALSPSGAGIQFEIRLPSVAFNRKIDEFKNTAAELEGRLVVRGRPSSST